MTKRGSLAIGCLVFLLFRAATIPDYFTSIESDPTVTAYPRFKRHLSAIAVRRICKHNALFLIPFIGHFYLQVVKFSWILNTVGNCDEP